MNKDLLIKDIQKIREQSPLVQSITNYVVMNNTANALLSIGASPVMAHAVDEMEEMVGIASALVINIGTLDETWVPGMFAAGKAAYKRHIPCILDPVGAGATSYRTQTCLDLIEDCHPSIIRGNGSEIMALVNSAIKSKGVDSIATSDSALTSAQQLARMSGAVVVISGQIDYITDGNQTFDVPFGSPMMTRVTGLGCTASALTGAFAAVNSNLMEASTHAMEVMSIAGCRAAEYSKGNGSLQVNFLDELYNLSDEVINQFTPKL